jgi:hypothetical protein
MFDGILFTLFVLLVANLWVRWLPNQRVRDDTFHLGDRKASGLQSVQGRLDRLQIGGMPELVLGFGDDGVGD